MAELTDADIVALAVGVRIHISSRLTISPLKFFKLSEDKTIRERARKIVLREVVRLTRGEDVGERMPDRCLVILFKRF